MSGIASTSASNGGDLGRRSHALLSGKMGSSSGGGSGSLESSTIASATSSRHSFSGLQHPGDAPLRVKRNSYSSEFKASLVQVDSQSSLRSSQGRAGIKLATLRHENVGFYGRSKEVAQLQACLDRLNNDLASSGSGAGEETGTNVCQPSTEKEDTNSAPPDTTKPDMADTNNANASTAPEEDAKATIPADTEPKKAIHKPELALISGFSGTGKTTLTQHLKLPPGAAFVIGKCDLNAREEPYSSMADACEALCQKLLQDATMAQKARDLLLDQLGVQIMAHLWELMPSLRRVIATNTATIKEQNPKQEQAADIPTHISTETNTTDESSLSVEAKQQQMNYAFRVLIRVFSECYQPLVLCIDDLQWSDTATLQLLELLLTDIEHKNLFLIGCYRSNQVDEQPLLPPTLEKLRQLASKDEVFHITEVELNNLSVEDCNTILMDLLSTQDDQPDKTLPLAAICHKRTLGNVNFLLQFITMLQETGLLHFSLGLMQWQWNLTTIEQETHAADNVIAVVERRMAQLTRELRHFLSVASSIGASASFRILELAWKTCKDSQASDALTCVEQVVFLNFMEPCRGHASSRTRGGEEEDDNKYKFVHDKIQEAARKLWPQEERQTEQFQIGMALLNQLSEKEQHAEIFLIRDLLDAKEHKDLTDAKEIDTIVRINTLASERARSFSAFQSSFTYAQKGLSLLKDKSWETHYDTTLQLHNLACEAAEATGQPKVLEELSEIVLARPECSLLDKMRIYKVKLDRMANDGDPKRLKEAIDLCIHLLKQLGCKVPWRPAVPMSVVSSLLHFKRKVPTEGTLRALPRMTDTKLTEAMHILYRLQGYAYFDQDIMLSTWSAVKIAKMTLKHGRHLVSSTSFPAIGYAMTGAFGEFQKGTMYSRHGEILVDMEKDKSKAGRTDFTVLAACFYTKPINETKEMIRGYKLAMQAGDTESALFCLGHHCWVNFMRGYSLDYLEADCHRYLAQAKQLQRLNGVYFLAPLAELVATLTGSRLGVETYLDKKSSELLMDHVKLARTLSAGYMGNYQEGADIYMKHGGHYEATYPAMPVGVWYKFLGGLCLYAAAIATGKRKYLQPANKIRETLHSWVKKGNPNSNHHACLLDAEFYRAKKQDDKASKFYENAAIMAGRAGLRQDAALAYERHAMHILASKAGKQDEARYRMHKAIKLYTEWGAAEKVRQLEAKYRDLLSGSTEAPFE